MSEHSPIFIGARPIGRGQPTFVIAEIGVNHNGDPSLARTLVTAAAEAGADAVKFQTFRAEALASSRAGKARYQVAVTGEDGTQQAMLKKLELPDEELPSLMALAESLGVCFLSSPFDLESADTLDRLGVPAFKIPSGELTNGPLLTRLSATGRPLLVSTGMAYLSEVQEALAIIDEAGKSDVILLHCVSSYPAPAAAVNLRALNTLEAAFGLPVGYSDHTTGNGIAIAAVALGACVIEKHFTLDCTLPGPDHRASIEPAEFRAMVSGIRDIEAALGNGRKRPNQIEMELRDLVRKSLAAARPLKAGTTLTADDVAIQRPGDGLAPHLLPHVLGRRVRADVGAGGALVWTNLD